MTVNSPERDLKRDF